MLKLIKVACVNIFNLQPPSGGCVLKLKRWCNVGFAILRQPPSGGCVLKHLTERIIQILLLQPPSGGCVLKPREDIEDDQVGLQPPSGGCVLKQLNVGYL